MIGTRKTSWVKILFAILLLAGLPIFIWAVVTQRIELRKRAATAEPTEVCWNRVVPDTNGGFNWPNSCKGSPRTDIACTPILIPLTTVEIIEFRRWQTAGYPYIPGCNMPIPPPPIGDYRFNWSTPYASLEMNDLIITANGKTFSPKNIASGSAFSIHSDPGDPNYTTLEAIWTENNVEMRMFIYFNADTVTTGTPYRRWWVNEIRTYNGNTPGDWIYYRRAQLSSMAMTAIGVPYQTNALTLTSTEGGTGVIQFTNLRLQGFLNQNRTPTPPGPVCSVNGSVCTITTCPPPCPTGINCTQEMLACTGRQGICTNNVCVVSPTPPGPVCSVNGTACTITYCPPMPICPAGVMCTQQMPACSVQPGICSNNVCIKISPTPTPPSGCYYQQVTCVKAPCSPVLVCPSPTLNEPPITQPPSTCIRKTPKVTIAPADQSGNPGETLTYSVTVTNTDSLECPLSNFGFSTDTEFPAQLPFFTQSIPAGSSSRIDFTVTSPNVDPYSVTTATRVNFNAGNTSSNLSGIAKATYTIVKPVPQTFKLLVKLAGVSGTEATGANILVKIKLKDGTMMMLDKPLVLSSVGGGTYSATATLTNPLPKGTQFRILIKGEKHSQVVFCEPSGQTVPCTDTEYMNPTDYSFDFTGRPLPPGDLNQDGRINSDDLKLITDLFSKPSSQQTAQDLKTADVNYSGKVDSLDLSLIFQTLETRYDEQ